MKSIKIITFNKAHNYGAMLQAYALQKKLTENYEVSFINYHDRKIEKGYKVFKICKKNIFTIIKSSIKSIMFFSLNCRRSKTFKNFLDSYLFLDNILYDSVNELKKNPPVSDVYITGSDQVWNPQIVGELSDAYTLNFGNKEVKKISYAASVGDVNSILSNKKEYKDKISKLDKISVREDDAKYELEKIIDKDIDVVLDPTLLILKKDWEHELEHLNGENQKYICAYMVKADEEYIKIVNDLSKKTGLKVIHFGLRNPGYKNVLKSAYTDGPLEFVNYIKNAEYVVATSFHATVFSILFNKKFFIIPHRKTGARVTNLLDKLGIRGRTFTSLEEFKNIDYNFETDWDSVEKRLQEERQKSLDWLKNAIEGEMN